MGESAPTGKGSAGPASVAALGLSAYSAVAKGEATEASDDFQASKAGRAAEFGKLQAGLSDTVARENLNTTLGNIAVIRAAAHIDPTSPTTAVLMDRQEQIGERQRRATQLSLLGQADEDAASAEYLRKSGDYARNMGYLNAGITVASGLAKMAGGAG